MWLCSARIVSASKKDGPDRPSSLAGIQRSFTRQESWSVHYQVLRSNRGALLFLLSRHSFAHRTGFWQVAYLALSH